MTQFTITNSSIEFQRMCKYASWIQWVSL